MEKVNPVIMKVTPIRGFGWRQHGEDIEAPEEFFIERYPDEPGTEATGIIIGKVLSNPSHPFSHHWVYLTQKTKKSNEVNVVVSKIELTFKTLKTSREAQEIIAYGFATLDIH